jgi:hypothetical protein
MLSGVFKTINKGINKFIKVSISEITFIKECQYAREDILYFKEILVIFKKNLIIF